MPQIPGYDTQFTPQGALPMGASPDAFGAGIGQALGNVAGAMEALNEQYQKMKDNEAAIEAYDLSGKTIAAWKQELTDRVNALNPEDPDFKARYEEIYTDTEMRLKESRDSIIQNSTNPKAKKYLAQHLATGQGSVLNMARQMQAEVASAHMGAKLDSSLKRSQDSIAADPSDENYNREVEGARNVIGSLGIDPEKKIRFERGFSHGAAVTQVQSLVARDARGFLYAIGATGGRVKKGGGLTGEIPTGAPEEKNITLDIAGAKLSVPQFQGGVDITEKVQSGAMAAVVAAKEAGAPDSDWPKYLSPEMKALVDGPAPQVKPMTDTEIAQAMPNIAGWAELTWAEKVAAVRQAEANLGGTMAQKRAETNIKLKDAEEAAKRGLPFNYTDPDLSEASLRQQLGDAAGQRAYDQLQYTAKVGAAVGSMARMTNPQVQNLLAQYQPTGGEGTDYKAPLFDVLSRAAATRQNMINQDFVSYAQTQGLQVAPLDLSSPQAAESSFAKRVPLAATGVAEYGAPTALPVSKPELEQYRRILSGSNPDAAMAYIGGLFRATRPAPEVFDATMRALSPGDPILPTVGYLAQHQGMVRTELGDASGEYTARMVWEGHLINQGKSIEGKEVGGRPMQIDDGKFRSMFNRAVGKNAFAGPDSAMAEENANRLYQASKDWVASYLYHHHGSDGKQVNEKMVRASVDVLTGGAVQIGDNSLFVPWGMPKQLFSSRFYVSAGKALEAAGIKAPPQHYQYANAGDGRYYILHPNGSRISNTVVDMRNWKAELDTQEKQQKAIQDQATQEVYTTPYIRGGF